MSQQKTTAIYVVSTHWDREWYEPFQGFRYYLVELLDEVLDTMAADERFACFQTDGQSIILEDYLEIRPEREEQVRRFAQAGRLRIGPWYTMPDENLVAPEALIRNLEEGIRVARGFGNVSKVGFVCDIFGHVAQLPQIFRQFGIKGAFVFRGVNEDTHGGAFRWSGADGTEIPALRFGPNEGYCDLAGKIRMGTGPEGSFGLDEAVQKLAGYVDGQRLRTGMNTVLLFDGADHLPIEPQTVALVEGLRRARPDLDVRFGGLDEFAVALEEHAARLERKAEGELRAPGRLVNDGACLIPGVLSSRMRLKQANRACESDLLLWAEPFSHMASMLTGAEYPHGFIRHAWRNLLQNHAHDSICGCSPDQVHKDMEYRFDQARLIAEKVTESALRRIAARVKAPNVAGEDLVLVVFNPSQAAVDGPVDLELWFDVNTRNTFGEFFNFESKVGFRLLDADGVEVPYDYLGYAPRRKRFERVHRKFPRSEDCIVVRVTAPLRVPALGYATLVCRPEPARTRHPAGSLVTSTCSMENEHLRVEVQSNGSLSLLDKRTQQLYERGLVIEERADIGDGWYHGVAVNDRIYSSKACPADVSVVANGRFKATLRIVSRMEIPECFEFGAGMCRSARRTTLLVESDVTLRVGAAHLEVTTRIDNQARDHRIRMLFDTGATCDTYRADSAFDVVERPIALPADNHTYKELAVETGPHATWTSAHDGQRGLAIVAPALPETAVCDLPARPIALTLLRGFRRTVFRSDDETGGQSLGPHAFQFCIVPLGGAPDAARLAQIAQMMMGGVRAIQVAGRDQGAGEHRTLDSVSRMLTLRSRDVVLSSLRRHPEKGYLEVRLYNPTDKSAAAECEFAFEPASSALTDFEGHSSQPCKLHGKTVSVTLAPKRIVTLAVSPP